MKQFYITTILLFLTIGIMNAQPTITYGNNALQIGDIFTSSGSTGNYDPGPAGANQNWDFSNIAAASTTTTEVVSPAGTPFAGEFTESNICFSVLDDQVWTYGNINSSRWDNNGMGVVQDPQDFLIHYTNPETYIQYPFSYGNSFTDTYFASFSLAPGLETRSHGSKTVEADAWGSIITPIANYSSSLRVKTTTTETDSTFVNGMLVSTFTSTDFEYSWFVSSVKPPVVSITVFEEDVSASYTTGGVGIGNLKGTETEVGLYPNPAVNTLNINLPDETDEAEIFIYNQIGQQILKTVRPSGSRVSLDVSYLNSGIYFVKVLDRANNVSTGKFIKK